MLDQDGYPTEETLEKIKNWDYKNRFYDLMEFVQSIWRYADVGYWEQEENEYKISTGGWSGNEDIIRALSENHLFWMLSWWSSNAGGHYVFNLRDFHVSKVE